MKIAETLPNAFVVEEKLKATQREARALRFLLRAIRESEGKGDRPRAAVGDRSKGK